MQALADLVPRLHARYPGARIKLDPPLRRSGTGHLDVALNNKFVVVEWNETYGFGVSLLLEMALDGGPDIRLSSADEVMLHIAALLDPEGSHASP